MEIDLKLNSAILNTIQYISDFGHRQLVIDIPSFLGRFQDAQVFHF